MKKRDILIEAAEIIEETAMSLRDSETNPRTGKVDDEETSAKIRRELYIASKLREYGK